MRITRAMRFPRRQAAEVPARLALAETGSDEDLDGRWDTVTATTTPMLKAYPGEINVDRDRLAIAIDALTACAQACTGCADACLSEANVGMFAKCIRIDLDCADICAATIRVLSRHTGYDANISRSLLEACATACRSCRDECQQYAGTHEHCRICAEACRVAEQACRDLLAAMG